MSATSAHGRTVDPRVQRSLRVIREAALAELADSGYGRFAIESVAERAGVSKSTIYRHWDSKPALILDVLETLNQQPLPVSAQGTPRSRVDQLLGHFADVLADPVRSAALTALIDASERHPTIRELFHDYSARRQAALIEAIADGMRTGTFPRAGDPVLAAAALVGALLYQRVMTGDLVAPGRLAELVDTVLGS